MRGRLTAAAGAAWRGMLHLDAGQRQALMTWGLLLGIVAQSGIILTLIVMLDKHVGDPPTVDVVRGLFTVAYAMIGLQVLLAFGVVAIARGGTLMLNITRDGATIEARASGKAAQEMAKDGISGTGV